MTNSEHIVESRSLRSIIVVLLAFLGFASIAAAVVFAGLVAVQTIGATDYVNIVKLHFLATIGVPSSAAAALGIVGVMRFVEGKMTFKGLGFEFDGASAPVVLWVMVFLAINLALANACPLITATEALTTNN